MQIISPELALHLGVPSEGDGEQPMGSKHKKGSETSFSGGGGEGRGMQAGKLY